MAISYLLLQTDFGKTHRLAPVHYRRQTSDRWT